MGKIDKIQIHDIVLTQKGVVKVEEVWVFGDKIGFYGRPYPITDLGYGFYEEAYIRHATHQDVLKQLKKDKKQNTQYEYCENCGILHEVKTVYNNKYYCWKCAEKLFYTCKKCNTIHPKPDITFVGSYHKTTDSMWWDGYCHKCFEDMKQDLCYCSYHKRWEHKQKENKHKGNVCFLGREILAQKDFQNLTKGGLY